jgi:acetolactate decarboxylase
MEKFKIMKNTFSCFLMFLFPFITSAQNVKNIGSMTEMGKENFAAHISLDSIANKKHLFGMGPYGRMQGEISVWDGVPYFSEVGQNGEGIVSKNWQMEAPFFVYANVSKWRKYKVNLNCRNLEELQKNIENIAKEKGYRTERPFVIKIKGEFNQLTTHIVMPRSSDIPSYQANKKQADYDFEQIEGEILIFYSQKHQGIYTHKDSFIHAHFLSKDKKTMGHIDKINTNRKVEMSFSNE